MTDNIEKWMYFMRQFTHLATRYPLQTPKCNDKTNTMVFARILDITHFREIEDLFIKDIRELKIYKINLEKLNLFFNDLRSDFFKTIDCYNDWYLKKKQEIEINEEYYFYKTFYESGLMTKEEIVKCEIETQKLNTTIDQYKATELKEESLLRFDNTAQKYILLKELGLIDFLNEKYPNLSNAKKGVLLAYITDNKSNKSFENIQSQIGYPNSEHYPFKEDNINKVNHILAQIGIPKQTTIASIKTDKKK